MPATSIVLTIETNAMNNVRLAYLLEKFFTDQMSVEEEQELQEHMTNDVDAESEAMFAQYYEQFKKPMPFPLRQKDAVWKGIQQQIGRKERRWPSLIRIAAAVLLFFTALAGWYLYFKTNINHDELYAEENILLKNNRASVYLKGADQDSASAMNDVALAEYGVQMDSSGTLLFHDQVSSGVPSKPSNLVIKSNQAQIQALVLADGTKVWLNSNSSIVVPTRFSGIRRNVVLTGEAYFEVAKNPLKPFQVKAGALLTEVLGTHFSVNSSNSEDATVTLMEGKVKVSNASKFLLLAPGQQAVGGAKAIDKFDVDLLDLLSWKEGYFKFDNASITEIMNQIKDWYDVKYVQIEVNNTDRFSGTYKRTNQLTDLLKNLEEVSSITFKIKEGGIHVVNK